MRFSHFRKKYIQYGVSAVLLAAVVFVALRIGFAKGGVSQFNTDGVSCSSSEETGAEIMKDYTVSKDGLSMTYSPDSFLLTIVDQNHPDVTFRSYPEAQASDGLNALSRLSLRGLLNVEYCTKGNNDVKTQVLNNSEMMRAFKIQNGLSLQVAMQDLGIEFTVEMRLKSGYLEVLIPSDSVRETGDSSLISITVLPFLGASRQGDDGYAVIPDGIGAVTYFNQEHTIYSQKGYSKQIYGSDMVFSNGDSELDETIKLPFYGIVLNNCAITAIAETGASDMLINVSPPGYKNYNFYHENFTFMYRNSY